MEGLLYLLKCDGVRSLAPPLLFGLQTMLTQGRDRNAVYLATGGRPLYDELIFSVLWARTVTALSYVFDHCPEDQQVFCCVFF